jgi:hypothetical protein
VSWLQKKGVNRVMAIALAISLLIIFFGSIIYFILGIYTLMISWHYNHSIFWLIVHYIFWPVYLLYELLTGHLSPSQGWGRGTAAVVVTAPASA